MPRTCRITVSGLDLTTDFGRARGRLLASFPRIEDVVATTSPGTLLVVYSGRSNADAWVETLHGMHEPSAPRSAAAVGWHRFFDLPDAS